MYELQGKTMIYRLDSRGRSVSCYHRQTGHEYIHIPGAVWKLIYAVKNTERVEVPVWAEEQRFSVQAGENSLTLCYDGLTGDEGRKINASLNLHFQMNDLGLQVWADLENRDPEVTLMELQLTPVSGARTLAGEPDNDFIAWPNGLGRRVRRPAYADLSTFAGFRKYERHDQYHTDMDALYPSDVASMQWYDWYTDGEGLYCSSEDTTHQTVGLHIERDAKLNVLRFGFIRYPMIDAGERFTMAPIDCYPHLGDWHAGAKLYRAFMEEKGGFVPPVNPEWSRDMTGWLRLIFKQHHCELNWSYADIPTMYDELEACGLKTLYLLGWEAGGFARLWPDFRVDERMGGEKLLREGIEYVHQKGGKVLMFLSYALIDHHSDFYQKEGGDKATIRSIWGEDIPFAETYCGEGTYRKIGNPAMPMYLACPGAPIWQEKMKESAKTCLELGADGVLYDIGSWYPYFCYAEGHTHAKPSHSHESKAANYAGLREYIKTFGQDKIILMEHNTDIFGQSMDISHSANTQPPVRLRSPETARHATDVRNDLFMPEMYRYTFPELVATNRECGEDEECYKAMAGFSFLYGLRFDMTIYRCCGSLRDIPRYAAYLKELSALYEQYGDYLLRGRFVDSDGFISDSENVLVKGWEGCRGGLAVSLWNPTGEDQAVTLRSRQTGRAVTIVVPAERAAAAVIDEA